MRQLWVVCLVCVCSGVFAGSVFAGDVVDRGVAEFKAGKYRAALRHLQAPAEAGNAEAQLYMGRLYAGGRAGVMDDFEAANWFEKAARQDNAVAQYQLARLYLSGWGLSKNTEVAMEWLWKSGRLGFVNAQLLLGKLFAEGKVVPEDVEKARLWYAQAASQGSVKARDELEKLGGAAALPDGGEGLSATAAPQTAVAQDEMGSEDRAAIVKRRIEELKAARKGADSSVTAVPVAAAAVVVVEAGAVDIAVEESGDQLVLEEVAADTAMDTGVDDAMEVNELVLEEFETDGMMVDEVLEQDVAVDVSAADVPVEQAMDAPTPAIAVEPEPEPEPELAQQSADDGVKGKAWVQAREPAHYTIQLLGSWKRSDALTFVAANPLPGAGALIETRRRGKPWFSLYYGDFASYSKAVAAQSALSGGIAKHGPWVRPFRKIQAGLK